MLPLTPTPPVTTTVPVVELEEAVPAVNVTAPFAVSVVNAPLLAVEAPIGVLLMEPVVIVAPVIVLLVSVSEPAKVARVPVVGSVTLVLAEVVSVKV
jgi:hypothetical protein